MKEEERQGRKRDETGKAQKERGLVLNKNYAKAQHEFHSAFLNLQQRTSFGSLKENLFGDTVPSTIIRHIIEL